MMMFGGGGGKSAPSYTPPAAPAAPMAPPPPASEAPKEDPVVRDQELERLRLKAAGLDGQSQGSQTLGEDTLQTQGTTLLGS